MLSGRRRRLALGLSLATAMAAIAVATPPAVAVAVEPAPDTAAGRDAAARDAAYDAYQSVLKPALAVPIGWTGSVPDCEPGAPSAAAQEATLQTLNYVRRLAGLTPVSFDAALSRRAQQAALIMQAQGALSHDPPPDWACWTQEGHDAAGQANLFGGVTGANAITGYMQDSGPSNSMAGHRRWILYPPQRVMGSGSTSGANALIVSGGIQDSSDTGPGWVPWPTAGEFPVQLEPDGRWSLGAPDQDTDFTQAKVRVERGGTSLPVRVEPVVAGGFANNTLVWQVDTAAAAGRADTDYTVTVTGIRRADLVLSHAYTVTLFDAEIDARQTISLPAIAGQRYGDVVTPVATASSGLPVGLSTTTPDVCSVVGGAVRMTGVGSCTVAADQPGDAVRRPAPTVTRTFPVGRRPVVVRADDQERPAGGVDPVFTVSYEGLVEDTPLERPDVRGAPSCTTTADVDSPPGSYPIDCAVGSLTSERHYSFTTASGTLRVNLAVSRLAGDDRIGTAVRISREQFPERAGAVFVATAQSFPDALAGGPAAVGAGAPILLTLGSRLPPATSEEVRRLAPQRIYVLGGDAAVPESVAAELASVAPVVRLAGGDRAGTAAAVSQRFFAPGAPVAFVATSGNFPDALAAGAAAALSGGPVILTSGTQLSPAANSELQRLRPGRVVVVGGTGAVSESVRSALNAIAPTSRIAGSDRYDTAAQVALGFFSPEDTDAAVLATGADFPDALAGTPLAGRSGVPLVLVTRDELPPASAVVLKALSLSRIVVLGGTSTVSEAVPAGAVAGYRR